MARMPAWMSIQRNCMMLTYRSVVVGLFVGTLHCQSHVRGESGDAHVPRETAAYAPEPPRSPGELNIQLAYQVGPAPECSNWYAALRKARNWLSCDPFTNRYRTSARNPCQERVQSCDRGCDVCPIIGPGMGPPASFDDLGPIARDPRDPNVIYGVRGKQSIGRGHYTFNQRLCEDISWVDVLGSTIFHEALHHCHGGFGISDFASNQSGCSASALERFCTGISIAGGL